MEQFIHQVIENMARMLFRNFIIVVVILILAFLFLEDSSEKPEPPSIKIENLPAMKKPSQFPEINQAIQSNKPLLLAKINSYPKTMFDDKRKYFFLLKLFESYKELAVILYLPKNITFEKGDYLQVLLEHIPHCGFGILKNVEGVNKFYAVDCYYSGNIDNAFEPIEKTLNKYIGKSDYSRQAFLDKESKYPQYNNAEKEGKSLILYSLDRLPLDYHKSEVNKLLNDILPSFSDEAEIIEIKGQYFTDPVNELFDICKKPSAVIVYNAGTKKVYPVFFPKKPQGKKKIIWEYDGFSKYNTKRNIRKSLDLR